MKIRRHYYISDDLDELEAIEQGLERAGVSRVQIHVLSDKDADVERHANLHEVHALMKRDIVHSALRGAMAGVLAAALVLALAYGAGWTRTAAGWTPFVLFALVLFGFSTWEGGLSGIQKTNRAFAGFPRTLHAGQHVLFVDLEPPQEGLLAQIVGPHPKVQQAGTGRAMPHWLVSLRRGLGAVHRVFP